MTREEAKKRLEVWLKCMVCPEDKQCYDSYLKSTCEYTDYCDETPIDDAIRVAIQALEQEPKTGHWNLFHTTEHGMREDNYFKCNRCNYESYKEYNFCPDCGVRMENEKNE